MNKPLEAVEDAVKARVLNFTSVFSLIFRLMEENPTGRLPKISEPSFLRVTFKDPYPKIEAKKSVIFKILREN